MRTRPQRGKGDGRRCWWMEETVGDVERLECFSLALGKAVPWRRQMSHRKRQETKRVLNEGNRKHLCSQDMAASKPTNVSIREILGP